MNISIESFDPYDPLQRRELFQWQEQIPPKSELLLPTSLPTGPLQLAGISDDGKLFLVSKIGAYLLDPESGHCETFIQKKLGVSAGFLLGMRRDGKVCAVYDCYTCELLLFEQGTKRTLRHPKLRSLLQADTIRKIVQEGALVLSPDGRFLAISRQPRHANQNLLVFEYQSGLLCAVLSADLSDACYFSPDGESLICCGEKGTTAFPLGGRAFRLETYQHQISPNGLHTAFLISNGELYLGRQFPGLALAPRRVAWARAEGKIGDFFFSPDSTLLLVRSNKLFGVVSVEEGAVKRRFSLPNKSDNPLERSGLIGFSPDNQRVYLGQRGTTDEAVLAFSLRTRHYTGQIQLREDTSKPAIYANSLLEGSHSEDQDALIRRVFLDKQTNEDYERLLALYWRCTLLQSISPQSLLELSHMINASAGLIPFIEYLCEDSLPYPRFGDQGASLNEAAFCSAAARLKEKSPKEREEILSLDIEKRQKNHLLALFYARAKQLAEKQRQREDARQKALREQEERERLRLAQLERARLEEERRLEQERERRAREEAIWQAQEAAKKEAAPIVFEEQTPDADPYREAPAIVQEEPAPEPPAPEPPTKINKSWRSSLVRWFVGPPGDNTKDK